MLVSAMFPRGDTVLRADFSEPYFLWCFPVVQTRNSRHKNQFGIILYFFAFSTPHRFFWASEILARASGLRVRFFFAFVGFAAPSFFAHRACCAAAIFARVAAERLVPLEDEAAT